METDQLNCSAMTVDEVNVARLFHTLIQDEKLCTGKSLIALLSPETRQRIVRPNTDPYLDPALLFAIESGNLEFVKLLVDECSANWNEKICVRHRTWFTKNGYYMRNKSLTPLEIAIWTGTTDIVDYLVSLGADLDSVAKDANTLNGACKPGSIETLKMLLQHGADVNAVDEGGSTCLLKVVDDLTLCRFLLDNGADINEVDDDGNTALHLAARFNSLSTVRLLVERGADVCCKNIEGSDALYLACDARADEIVDFLSEKIADVNRRIEAFQFLGTRSVYEGELWKALSAWRKAIELSSKHAIAAPAATLDMPFDTVIEATTLAELDDLSDDDEQICLQSVLLTHKLFGPIHTEFFSAVFSSVKKFFENGLYDRWVMQLIYWFDASQNPEMDDEEEDMVLQIDHIHSHIQDCLEEFIKKAARPSLDFDFVYEFVTKVVEKATACTDAVEKEDFMILILNIALIFGFVDCDEFQKTDFHNLVRSAIQPSTGGTLLLHAVQSYKRLHFQRDLPHLGVITMLVESGVDVNERDRDGNNALHIVMASYMDSFGLFRPLGTHETLARMFVEHGAHLDARNRKGFEATSGLQEMGINAVPPINLMCSAARAIRRFNISVTGIIPEFLIDFVEMH